METAERPAVSRTSRRATADAPVPVLPLVDALPRLAAFFLVALGLVGTPLMLVGQFRPLPVVLLGGALLVALELAWRRVAPRPSHSSRSTAVVSLLALLVAALSTAANARWGSQHLLVDGDPAVYAVTGQLLASTGALEIETLRQSVFGGVPSFNHAGAGFDANADESVVLPSFMHLLPQALAVASWVGGPQALLWMNAVLSGAALLAVFAFAARFLGRPLWALGAMTALAVSLPQLHFSRDTFSEIPAQLLVFAGLALVHDAVSRRRDALLPGLVPGLVLGVSCLARIDAFFYLVPLTVLVTVLALAGARLLAAGLAAGVALGAVLGYVDLRVGSPNYLGLQSEKLNLIFAALGLTVLVCAAALVWRRRAVALWERVRGRTLAAAVAGTVALLSAFAWFVRPHVQEARGLSPRQPTAVASLQEAAGLPVDPLRSYDELSLEWLTWYLGPVAVALGLVGFTALVYRTLVRHRTPAEARAALAGLAFLLVFGASTALYVWRPSIIPVQYWATRRFLPVTIPGLLVCAAWLAAAVPRPRARAVVGAVVAVALLLPPLLFLRGHATEREYVPMLAITEQLCEELRPDDAVVLLGGGRIATGLPQTLQIFCEVPVAVVDAETTRAELAAAADAAADEGRRLVLLSPVPDPVVADGPVDAEFEKAVDLSVSVVALELTGRPDERFTFPMTLYLAPVG
jgi:hypothetical protein